MRLSPLIFAALSPMFAAAAQTPAPKEPPAVLALRDPLSIEQVERLPPNVSITVATPDGVTPMKVEDILKLLREGKEVRPALTGRPLGCAVDDAEILAEQKASNENLLKMQRRGEIIPLQHQYEQELYYRERFAKAREGNCDKAPAPYPDGRVWFEQPPMPDMTLKACRAIAPDCQPRKHW